MDPYTELGLARSASDHDIAAAHRAGVKQHHPDRGGRRDQFDRVQRAFDILNDPVRRRHYDETGVCDETPGSLRDRKVIAAAREALMSVVLGQQDLAKIDVVGAAIAYLDAKSAALQIQGGVIATNLQRLELARARIKNISAHEDVVAGLFTWQAGELAAAEHRVDLDRRVQEAAVEILKRYSYEMDLYGGIAVVSREGRAVNVTVGQSTLAPAPGGEDEPPVAVDADQVGGEEGVVQSDVGQEGA